MNEQIVYVGIRAICRQLNWKHAKTFAILTQRKSFEKRVTSEEKITPEIN